MNVAHSEYAPHAFTFEQQHSMRGSGWIKIEGEMFGAWHESYDWSELRNHVPSTEF